MTEMARNSTKTINQMRGVSEQLDTIGNRRLNRWNLSHDTRLEIKKQNKWNQEAIESYIDFQWVASSSGYFSKAPLYVFRLYVDNIQKMKYFFKCEQSLKKLKNIFWKALKNI